MLLLPLSVLSVVVVVVVVVTVVVDDVVVVVDDVVVAVVDVVCFPSLPEPIVFFDFFDGPSLLWLEF